MTVSRTTDDAVIRLSREIRFSLTSFSDVQSRNSWAGWPLSHRLDPWLKTRLVVRGSPDPETGFVCNVTELDRVVRDAIPDLVAHYRRGSDEPPALDDVIQSLWPGIKATIAAMSLMLERMEIQISPHAWFHIDTENEHMVIHTQQFEFSAAHRLFHPEWSDEVNQRVFGKCNNPNGHGHNYVVEVSVSLEEYDADRGAQGLDRFQQVVNREIIDRLDHKHLNLDIEYFQAVNPTVENIAVAIWTWLEEPLRPIRLRRVRVYETPKTWAEYDGRLASK